MVKFHSPQNMHITHRFRHSYSLAIRKKCDFICWTPHGLFFEIIDEDSQLQNEITSKCKDFFVTDILPEILTQRLKNGGTTLCNEQKYCYCRRGEEGLIIACSNPSCNIEWFHYSCVGVTSKPKGQSFCDDCKALN